MGALDQAESDESRDATLAYRSSIGEYVGDPSLSDQEIAAIAAWVDAGGPEGRAADAPPPRTFASTSKWTYGEPDLVVRMQKGFTIPADGPDFIPEEIVDPKITEDRYVKWVQIIPAHPGRSSFSCVC